MPVLPRPNPLYHGDRLIDRLYLRLFTAEHHVIGEEWDSRDVCSSYWRFYANADEGAYLTLPGDGGMSEEAYPLEAGRLYFVPAGVRFHCGMRPGARVRHFFVHFDAPGLPGLALRELSPRPSRLPPEPFLEAEAARLAAHLQTRGDAPDADDLALHCRLKSLLYGALAAHLHSLSEAGQEGRLLDRRAARLEPVRPALEFVEENLAGRISNADLAACCFLSEDHFVRRFRECVGVSPAAYVQERRVEAAAQRLLFGEESIDAVAAACGFSNRYYFTRVFTQHTGQPPAAYRKAARV